MDGSRAKFASGPDPRMNRTTPVKPRTSQKSQVRQRGTTQKTRETLRLTRTALRQCNTPRPTKAIETKEPNDHRPAGTPDLGQSAKPARTGDHPHLQRAGQPPDHPPTTQGRLSRCPRADRGRQQPR